MTQNQPPSPRRALVKVTSGYYETRDLRDSGGSPYVIAKESGNEHNLNWVIRDSRGRFVSRHQTLTDARTSI